jgi:long-chain fatty acid transport protein
MHSNKTLPAAIAAVIACAGLLGTGQVTAAGFALMEQNTAGLGNAYAGAAAVAEDASTIFFNSAGLTQLKRTSLVLNGAAIMVNSKFRNANSQPALGFGTAGSNGGNAGGTTLVPALYLAVPVSDRITGGIGVNAPFGLKTEYSDDWLGRFQGILSDVKTVNVNAALAFKVNDVVSFGVGANHQSLDATLTKNVNYTAVIAQGVQQQLLPLLQAGTITLAQYSAQVNAAIAANAGLQGRSTVKGSDSAWGYDIGLLLNFNDRTRLGLSYRSALAYNVNGNASFAPPTSSNPTGQAIITAAGASTLANGPVTLAIKLPATARLALLQKLGSKVELLGEVSWTQWSDIPELRVKRTNGVTLSNTTENWDNTMRYAVGASYKLGDAVKLRIGAAIDKSPVPDATRTPRLPDADRTWLSAGARINIGKNVDMDLGYSYVKAKDAPLNQNDGNTTAFGLINGEHKTSINILGVQATVSF